MGETHPDDHRSEIDAEPVFTVREATGPEPKIVVKPEIDDVSLAMELDTGASVSIISEDTWKTKFAGTMLENTEIRLKTYTGEPMRVLGQLRVNVKYHNQEHTLPLLVVGGSGPSLFGRNWLGKIRLDWASINQVTSELDSLLEKFCGSHSCSHAGCAPVCQQEPSQFLWSGSGHKHVSTVSRS